MSKAQRSAGANQRMDPAVRNPTAQSGVGATPMSVARERMPEAGEGPAEAGVLARFAQGGRSAMDGLSNRAGDFHENIARWGADDVSADELAARNAAEGTSETQAGVSPDALQTAPDAQAPLGDLTTYADGKTKEGLQAGIDATFEAYDEVPVTLTIEGTTYTVKVEAKYRNVGANADWLGAKDVATAQGRESYDFADPLRKGEVDGIAHSEEFLDAYYGKASPEALGKALEEAVLSDSDLEARLQEATQTAEVEAALKEILEDWAQTRLGIDCSGFVWQVINNSGEYDDFSPEYDDKGRTAQSHEDRLSLVNAKGLLNNGVDLTGMPEEWRPMDVCGWSKHVLLIYDTEDTGDGVWRVTLVDSQAGAGPTKHDAYYCEGRWSSSRTKVLDPAMKPSGYLGLIEKVIRPTNPPDEPPA